MVPTPTFFDGVSDQAEDWIQTTKDFAIFNHMELNFAFDMLLRGDAKQLWQEFSSHRDSIANEEVEKWFSETFADVRTVCDKMKDFSSVQQRADEKYRSFEIRVRKMVDDIFNLKLSSE